MISTTQLSSEMRNGGGGWEGASVEHLARELPVRGLDVLVTRGAWHAQRRVVVGRRPDHQAPSHRLGACPRRRGAAHASGWPPPPPLLPAAAKWTPRGANAAAVEAREE
jgi:hypothetical protein